MDADYLRNINAEIAKWHERKKGEWTSVHIDNGFIISIYTPDPTENSLWHFCAPGLQVSVSSCDDTHCCRCGVKTPKTVQAVFNLVCLGV